VTSAVIVDLRRGDPFNVVIEGRTPQARDELDVGTGVAEALGVGLGDDVAVALSDGSEARFTIVGIAVHPNAFDGYRNQIALLGDSTDRFLSADEGFLLGVFVRIADGADPDAVVDRYRAHTIDAVARDAPPIAVDNVEEVRAFPIALAALLALLATVFLLHALAVGARRRGRELAVLKTLGFTTRQLRRATAWQVTTILVVSLGIGVPIGVEIGRAAWSRLAHSLSVVDEARLPSSPVLWLVGMVIVVNLLGLAVTSRSIRQRPAAAFRDTRRE
jgi:ABC-type lipoprotein release transport system permease subunit